MTLCNMVIEAGGKNGVIAPDQVTLDYVNARNKQRQAVHVVDERSGAKFCFEKVYDVTQAGAGGRQAAQPGQPGVRFARSRARSSTGPTSARAPAAR